MPKHRQEAPQSELAQRLAPIKDSPKGEAARKRAAEPFVRKVTEGEGRGRRGVVHAYRDAEMQNRDRTRIGVGILSIPIDPLTDRAAEWFFRTAAEGLLDNEGRVAERMDRTQKGKKVGKDVNRMLNRGEVNILDTDSYVPRIEEFMTLLGTLSDVKNMASGIPVFGPLVNFLATEGQTITKLFTADSGEAKAVSLITAQLISALNIGESVGGAVQAPTILAGVGIGTEFLTGVAEAYVNALIDQTRVERGLDTGDQVADFATLLAYSAIVKDQTIPADRRKNIARAIVDRYDRPPKKWKVKRHKKAKRKIETLKKRKEKVSRFSGGVKLLRRFSSLKGMKTFLTAEKILGSRVAAAENYPQSISQKVDYVMANAADVIQSMDTIISGADSTKEEVHEAKIQRAYWEFRLAYATNLKDLYASSREALDPTETQKIDTHNEAGFRRIHRIARPSPTTTLPAVR